MGVSLSEESEGEVRRVQRMKETEDKGKKRRSKIAFGIKITK
jgi:hypothetical protein